RSQPSSINRMDGRHVGTRTPDLYRVNFEVNDSKLLYSPLDFPHFKDLKTAEKCLVLMAN
ncbi:MAG: hypothetical protein DMG84_21165, partial [Acidobacteria bacterium]